MNNGQILARTMMIIMVATFSLPGKDKPKTPVEPSPLDKYISEAMSHEQTLPVQPTAGSLWSAASRLTDLGGDLRAVQVNDLVTVTVNEQASAVVNGATKTARVSSLKSSISSLVGPKSATGALNNLAAANTDVQLDGSGSTSRGTSITTTLSARVTHVLPNGYLVVEGTKRLQVNSESQQIVVRGIVRPIDLSPGNVIASDQIAQMEININGKGVVGDAIRRPNILYRLILGLLPF